MSGFYGNSGYVGQSMSVRAAAAYDAGESPMSKWTKVAILDAIEEVYGKEALDHCRKLSLQELRDEFLNQRGWHHSGKYFHETDFYGFNSDLENADVMALEHEKAEKVAHTSKVVWAIVGYKVWTGTRNHPRCQDNTGVATWTEKDGNAGMVKIFGEYKEFRRSSITVIRTLPGKPRKNSAIWKEVE